MTGTGISDASDVVSILVRARYDRGELPDRRQGSRPAEFTRNGIKYRWWNNVWKGSIFFPIVQRLKASYGLLINDPADQESTGEHKPEEVISVYCPTETPEDFYSCMYRIIAAIYHRDNDIASLLMDTSDDSNIL